MRKSLITTAAVIGSAIALAGCAAAPQQSPEPTRDYVWSQPDPTYTPKYSKRDAQPEQTMADWANESMRYVNPAKRELNAASRAINNGDIAGVVSHYEQAGYYLLAISESPDGGRSSSLVHKAGRLFIKASAQADGYDFNGAAISIDRATGYIETAAALLD